MSSLFEEGLGMTEVELRRTWTTDDGYIAVVLENTTDSGLMDPWFTAYVGVPEDHLAESLAYDDIPVEVHGGLTFGPRNELSKVDEDGEKDVTWFGWDYNHAVDSRREVEIQEPVEELKSAIEQFRELTAKDVVERKIRFLPDEILEKVEVETA